MTRWETWIPKERSRSTITRVSASLRWREKQASSAFCWLPPAATMARPAKTCWMRRGRLIPSPPTGNQRFAPSGRSQSSRAAASAPHTCAPRPPMGFPRAFASTSCSTISSPGRSREKLIYLKSDGSPWRPIVHIEIMSRAFIAALEAPEELVFNEAFNVGQTAHN